MRTNNKSQQTQPFKVVRCGLPREEPPRAQSCRLRPPLCRCREKSPLGMVGFTHLIHAHIREVAKFSEEPAGILSGVANHGDAIIQKHLFVVPRCHRPRRPQQAPGGTQEAPGTPGGPEGSRKPQEAPGSPRKPQEAPRRPQEAPRRHQDTRKRHFGCVKLPKYHKKLPFVCVKPPKYYKTSNFRGCQRKRTPSGVGNFLGWAKLLIFTEKYFSERQREML